MTRCTTSTNDYPTASERQIVQHVVEVIEIIASIPLIRRFIFRQREV